MRAELEAAFAAAVARAEPGRAVRTALEGPVLGPDVTLLALGKAAVPMARAATEALPGIARGVVVAPAVADVPGCTVIQGSHPVPDAGSLEGGRTLLEAARAAEGPVLCLISGGGSALAEVPSGAITLSDLQEMNELLLKAGADIGRMNVVRGAVSDLKAGGLVRAARGPVTALILSDVPGDDPAVVASGLAAPMAPDPARARAVLEELGLWDRVAPSVRDAIEGGTAPEPAVVDARIIGGNAASTDAAAGALSNWDVERWPGWTEGDVGEVAERIAAAIRAADGPRAIVAGGETTVRVTGGGLGGRNQELALRVALLMDGFGQDWAFLSGGTDGRDGPTDAAGALVDGGTLARMRAAGVDPEANLARNDAHPALEASGDLLRIGATGTNVADVMLALVH